jgi:WD40 repeat protein
MKKLYVSLFLMTAANMFASGGGADKYGNVDTGAHGGYDDGATCLSASSVSGGGSGGGAAKIDSHSIAEAIRSMVLDPRAAGDASAKGTIICLKILSDGRIAAGYEDNKIRIWNPRVPASELGDMVVLEGHGREVNCLDELPDGRIISASGDHTIRIWDLTKAKNDDNYVRVFAAGCCVLALAVLSNGQIVFGLNNYVQVVTLAKGENQGWSASEAKSNALYTSLLANRFNPSEFQPPAGDLKGLDFLLRCKGNTLLGCHNAYVSALTVLSDGRIVSGSEDRTIRIWDLKKNKKDQGYMRRLRWHKGGITILVCLSDDRIISASKDHTTRVWDLTKTEGEDGYVFRLNCSGDETTALLVLSDDRIVSASDSRLEGHLIRVWDIKKEIDEDGYVRVLGNYENTVSSIVGLLDDVCIFSTAHVIKSQGSNDITYGVVRSLKIDPAKIFAAKKGGLRNQNFGQKAVFNNPDLVDKITSFLTIKETIKKLGGVDKKCNEIGKRQSRFIEASKKAQLITRSNSANGRFITALSDGRIVYGKMPGEHDKSILIWDPARPNVPAVVFNGHTYGRVACVTLLSNGLIASGGAMSNVLVWDPARPDRNPIIFSVKPAWRYGWGGEQPNCLPISMTTLPGDLIVTGYAYEDMRLWYPAADKRHSRTVALSSFEDDDYAEDGDDYYDKGAQCILALPRNQIIAHRSDGSTAQVWSYYYPSRAPMKLGPFSSSIKCMAASVNGRVAIGLDDRGIMIWNSATPKIKPVLLGVCSDDVESLAVLPNGDVISGSSSGSVHLWKSDVQSPQPQLLRQHAKAIKGLAAFLDSSRGVSCSADGMVQFRPSAEFLREKAARTQDPKDYLVDGPGVYDILFPGAVKVNKSVAAEVQSSSEVETGAGGGGSKDDTDAESGGGGGGGSKED